MYFFNIFFLQKPPTILDAHLSSSASNTWFDQSVCAAAHGPKEAPKPRHWLAPRREVTTWTPNSCRCRLFNRKLSQFFSHKKLTTSIKLRNWKTMILMICDSCISPVLAYSPCDSACFSYAQICYGGVRSDQTSRNPTNILLWVHQQTWFGFQWVSRNPAPTNLLLVTNEFRCIIHQSNLWLRSFCCPFHQGHAEVKCRVVRCALFLELPKCVWWFFNHL